MAQNITETSTFETTVPSLITTDAVKGSVQGSDPNVGEANGPHINLANRTQHLNDNKVNKAGDTMSGPLVMNEASVETKTGGFTTFKAEKTGKMTHRFADDPVNRYTTGQKNILIQDASLLGLGNIGLTGSELIMVKAVLRDKADSVTAYIAFGMIDAGATRPALQFEAKSGATAQNANDGYQATGFTITINAGFINIVNNTGGDKTVDVIVELITLP